MISEKRNIDTPHEPVIHMQERFPTAFLRGVRRTRAGGYLG